MLHRVRKHAQARAWLKTAGTRPGGGIGSGESEGQKRTAHRDVVSIRAHLVRGCRVVDELTSRATVAVPHPPEGKAFASVCLSPSRELRVRRETSSVAITKQRKRINGDLPIARLRRLLWHSCCRWRCWQSRGRRGRNCCVCGHDCRSRNRRRCSRRRKSNRRLSLPITSGPPIRRLSRRPRDRRQR